MTDDSHATRFLERVAAVCASVGVELNLIKAWDHIVNPHTIKDRSEYERDLNVLVFFGRIKEIDGFAEDVFCPGLRQLARELNPFVVHLGCEDFSLDYLNFYCLPERKIEMREATLPEPETMRGDSSIDALAHHIAFRALRIRKVAKKATS